jgi:uncharacterized protein (DUF779 family)
MLERVVFTPAALAEVRQLKAEHGALIFHQSGGCCEGSAPMCFSQHDFRAGSGDVLLGTIDGCPFYIDGEQLARWGGDDVRFVIDLVPSSGGSFSLEASDDVRFITRAPA